MDDVESTNPDVESTNSDVQSTNSDAEAANSDAETTESDVETTDSAGTAEPATVTYAWSPAGDACADCGETADQRWRAGEGAADPDSLVCADCKEW